MNAFATAKVATFAVLLTLSTACAGHDRLLFVTKTNFGIDIDSTPPTAEITIARREGVIEPSYTVPSATAPKTLPVFAAFNVKGRIYNPAIFGVFSGGAAATRILGGGEQPPVPSREQLPKNDEQKLALARENGEVICLEKAPKINPFARIFAWLSGNSGVTRLPFYFATDTSFGLKLGWSGMTGAAPDTVKLGYNRKEFAFAPIHIRDSELEGDECRFQVTSPSFIAAIENNSRFFAGPKDVEVGQTQFFATGQAARQLASRPSIQRAIFARVAPAAAALENSELNNAIGGDIVKIFDSLNSGSVKQNEIVDKAVELALVSFPSDASYKKMGAGFATELEKSYASPKAERTVLLDKLRRYAEGRGQ